MIDNTYVIFRKTHENPDKHRLRLEKRMFSSYERAVVWVTELVLGLIDNETLPPSEQRYWPFYTGYWTPVEIVRKQYSPETGLITTRYPIGGDNG